MQGVVGEDDVLRNFASNRSNSSPGALRPPKDAGFDDDQIWSITECEDTFSYGPPHHYVNHIGHIATQERHDFETYYEETSPLYYE